MHRIAGMNITYQRYSLETFLDSMVKLGIDAVELWGAAPHLCVDYATNQIIEKIRKQIEQRSLELVCFTPEQCVYQVNLGAKDDVLRKRSIDYFLKCIDVAVALEAPKMLITSGLGFFDEPKDEPWKRAVESIGMVAAKAESRGLSLVLEPLTHFESNIVTNLDTLQRMMNEVGSPAIKAMLDTVPMSLSNESIEDYVEAFGENFVHIHFIDSDGVLHPHMAPGDGVLPLNQYLNSIDKVGYQGVLTLEIIGSQYDIEPEKTYELSLQHLLAYR